MPTSLEVAIDAIARRASLRAIDVPRSVTRVIIESDAVVIAPATGHVDSIDVAVILRARGRSLDLHAFRRYLSEFAGLSLDHGELASLIAEDVAAFCGCPVVVVEHFSLDEGMEQAITARALPPAGDA